LDRVSVCIPTYEGGSTLRTAIDSALEQRECDIEVIVGDNASTDNTREIVESYGPDRLKYFRHSSNIGYPANVNACLERATGDYVLILCADDFLLHNQVLADLLVGLKSGTFVAAHLPFQVYQERGDRCRPLGRPFSPLAPGICTPKNVLHAFTQGNGCFGWGWLFKRAIIVEARLQFETDHDMAPDTMFWLSLCMKGNIIELCADRPGYAFVMRENSLGGQLFQERALKVYEQLITFENRLFSRLKADLPEVAAAVSRRKFRYTLCEFAGLTQKAFTEGRISRIRALGLLMYTARRHPRSALNIRFLRNALFVMLPAAIRAGILAARNKPSISFWRD
jgi:glycosyltransferase involved in cell wall biosynthesis